MLLPLGVILSDLQVAKDLARGDGNPIRHETVQPASTSAAGFLHLDLWVQKACKLGKSF